MLCVLLGSQGLGNGVWYSGHCSLRISHVVLFLSSVSVDVNECIQAPSPCSVGECENTPGRYRCVCPAGFRANFQQTQCQGKRGRVLNVVLQQQQSTSTIDMIVIVLRNVMLIMIAVQKSL